MNGSALQSWWVLGMRGIAAVGFGALALIWPGITLLALIVLFATYCLLGGAVSVFGAVESGKRDDEWGLLLLFGLFSLGAGAIAFLHPGLTALILVLLIGAHALVMGALDIISAVRRRKTETGEWLLALSGVLSMVFGALVFLFPGAGALALVWLISLYALITGFLLLSVAFRMRSKTKTGYPDRDRRVNPDRRMSHAR